MVNKMSNFLYSVKNKKGEVKDFWIMNKSDHKKADFIFSIRFNKYVKPKTQYKNRETIKMDNEQNNIINPGFIRRGILEYDTQLSDECPMEFGTECEEGHIAYYFIRFNDNRFGRKDSWVMRFNRDRAIDIVCSMAKTLGLEVYEVQEE